MARIVCSRRLPDADEHRRLELIGEVIVAADDAEFARLLPTADAAVVIRPTTLGAELIAAAPHLRAVATVSSGVDHVSEAALAERQISLISGSGKAPDAVAEWVLWAMIGLRRGLQSQASSFAAGTLDWLTRIDGSSRELAESTVGIVGHGNVGRAVERLLKAFGATVLIHDPFNPPPGPAAVSSLALLCEQAEIVTVHVPLTADTHSLLGAGELALIGPSGLLVNCSRGEIVEQAALLEALRSGALGGAAIDCFDPEPPDPALLTALASTGRALLTPHLAGVSRRALSALCSTAVSGIQTALEPC